MGYCVIVSLHQHLLCAHEIVTLSPAMMIHGHDGSGLFFWNDPEITFV